MAKRTKKNAAPPIDNSALEGLQAALKFMEPAATKDDAVIVIRGGYATVFDGLVAIGLQVPGFADINANADYKTLKGIVAKCRAVPAFTYDDAAHRIKIVAGKLTAYVPCIPLADAGMAMPTPNMTTQFDGSALVTTLDIVGKVVKEAASRLLECTVYVRNGSAFATNGKVLWEHWHGQNLPDMSVPKIAVKIITAVKKRLTGFGCTFDGSNNVNSATFWFEANSFIRTQLYVERRPDLDSLLERPTQLFPIPDGLWEALDALEPTLAVSSGAVILSGKEVKTGEVDGIGGCYTVAGALPARLVLNHEYLLMLAPYVSGVDWIASPETVRFGGDNFRAVLMIMDDKQGETVAERKQEIAQQPVIAPQPAAPPPQTYVQAQPTFDDAIEWEDDAED